MVTAERKSFLGESEILRHAGVQHGVFTQAQARAAGFTPPSITRRVKAGVWVRVLPGVYRIGGTTAPPRTEAMAAVMWAGDGALLSHAAAAREWGIEGVRYRQAELWVPEGCTRTSSRVVVHRGTRLDRADRTELDGIPITTATRTLIDLAGRMEDDALLAAMEGLLRANLTTAGRLASRLDALRSSGRMGAGRLEALLAARPAGAAALESRLEARVWRLIERSGLLRPERQVWVVAGGRRYRLDFAWPDRRLAVECKGFAFHGGREHFEPGEDRTADLVAAHWHVLPVTWQQATKSPDLFLDRLAGLLSVRASSTAAIH